MEFVEFTTTVPLFVPALVEVKAKTPWRFTEDWGVIVVDPTAPVTLLPLVAVKTRLSDPAGAALVTVTAKFVEPLAMIALVPVKEVITAPS
jgi:hypothetical protein